MPGIVGYCSVEPKLLQSRSAAERMISAVLHQPWYQTTKARGASGEFACVHLGHFDHAVVATNAEASVGVILDGWVFGATPRVDARADGATPDDAARRCLHAYLEQGTSFVNSLNGQFNLLVWDDRSREVFLLNDRYGLRPWQYAHLGGTLYFAPEGKAILAAVGERGRLNQRMLVNALSWGRVWIGQETLFEDILLLPPASVLRWHEGQVSVARYWDYAYQPEGEIGDEFVERAVETFRDAVARQTGAGLRYGISLSGGLDSRAVLAALPEGRRDQLQAYSWGVGDTHDEVLLAKQTARALGVAWQYLPLAPADFLREAGRGMFLTEGLDLSVQSYGLVTYPAIRRQTDALLTGLALDLTMGGTYLSPELAAGQMPAGEAASWALRQSALFAPEDCLGLVRLKNAGELLEELRGVAARDWQTGSNDHPADQCDRFFLRARVWRYTFARQAWQRFFVEDVTPTFDNEFFDLLLCVPPAWRAGHRFYQQFLRRLDPRMMEVPYQRTMLPPAAPLELWPAGARLEEQKEQLYRDLWSATGGQVFVPYRRYSTNYDEWLRRDPAWIAATDDLLLGPRSLGCESFFEREAVGRLVAEHRSGRRANHKKIIQLMTLELFLRQFFG
ncbi:MAG: asparagine synthase-related protein [Pyrinomonadaceae bacterium]